jgi:hypothetical protein
MTKDDWKPYYYDFFHDVMVRFNIVVWDRLNKNERNEVVKFMNTKLEEIISKDPESLKSDTLLQMLKARVEELTNKNAIEISPPKYSRFTLGRNKEPINYKIDLTIDELTFIVSQWPEQYKALVMRSDFWNIPLKEGQNRTSAIMEFYTTTKSPITRIAIKQHILETPGLMIK